MPWVKKVPAIVQDWYLGSEAGTALADVLSGDINPSGHLPFSFPVRLQDVGAHQLGEYPGTRRDSIEVYDEVLQGKHICGLLLVGEAACKASLLIWAWAELHYFQYLKSLCRQKRSDSRRHVDFHL